MSPNKIKVHTQEDAERLRKLPPKLRALVGPTGTEGKEGREGKSGLSGKTGNKGDTGSKGDKGDPGDRGESGLNGDTGDQGSAGERGAKGEQGTKGAAGVKGTKGDRGTVGAAGAKGDKGDVGERGSDGLDGFDGEPGILGEKGLKGDKGFQGERGPKGDEGPTGERSKELSKRDRERIINEITRTLPSTGVAISPRANKPRVVAETLSTMQRDAVLPDNGTIIYNSTVSQLQALVDGVWVNIGRSAIATKTAAYTATDADDVIICDASARAFKVTLPTAVGRKGKIFNIKKIDSSTKAITVDGKGTDTIDDGTTAVLTVQYEAITVVSDGTKWWIL